MMRSCLAMWMVLLSVVLALGGQTMAGERSDDELARRLTELGIAAQQQSDHAAALAYFERAKREVDHPKIRYFQAKSLDALTRYEEALVVFRTLWRDPGMAKYAGEINAYIRAIVAEREHARLVAMVAQLRRDCPGATGPAAPPEPSTGERQK